MFWGRSLPVAGRTGTLATAYGRFVTPASRCAVGRVVAKTGTLHDVVSLSGVAISVDGRLRLFSILVNARPQRYPILATRQAVDALAAAISC
jgi:D-alanyl-D-alanine carboxypeptidase/D-alanyl-D-alanine-endopeptidase (penicillin-binding protein 4)